MGVLQGNMEGSEGKYEGLKGDVRDCGGIWGIKGVPKGD